MYRYIVCFEGRIINGEEVLDSPQYFTDDGCQNGRRKFFKTKRENSKRNPGKDGAMMKRLLSDIIFYLFIPLVIWNLGRVRIGAYYAMILSGGPGFVYIAYGLIKERNYSVTGIFILISIIIGRIGDLLARSPEGILWNGVYISSVFVVFYIITILVKRPMGLYIFVDYAYSQGFPRHDSKSFLRRKEWFKYSQLLTILFAISGLEGVLLKIWLINKFGVDGFNALSVISSINGYVLWVFQIIFCFYIGNKIRKALKVADT